MSLLNLLDDICILEIVLKLRFSLESGLPYTETWFLDDEIGVIFFLFDDLCADVVVYHVVVPDTRSDLLFIDKFPFYFAFEGRSDLFLTLNPLRVVGSWTGQLIFFWVFASDFS